MYKFTADQFNAFKIYNIIDPHDPVPKFNNGGRLGVDVPLHYVSRLDDFDVTIAGEHLLTHYSDFIQQYYADPGDTMDKAFPYGVAKGNNWDERERISINEVAWLCFYSQTYVHQGRHSRTEYFWPA